MVESRKPDDHEWQTVAIKVRIAHHATWTL